MISFIGTLAENIKILDGEEADKKNTNMVSVASPRLVVCIRDFHLQNIKDGRHYTPDQNLEDTLKPVDSANPQQMKYNKTKQAITDYFPKRKCFTVAQPAIGDALQNIESLDDNAIDHRFLQDMEALKKYVYDRKPKYICNASKKSIDGADLASLITSYVNALRQKIPIRCEDAYTQASRERNGRVYETVMKYFKKEMKRAENITKKEKLQDLFLEVFVKTLAKYREESFLFLQDEFQESAKKQMLDHFEVMKDLLRTRCHEVGVDKICKMYDAMFTENKETYYTTNSGYACYTKDMETLRKRFFEQMKDYDKDDLCVAFDELKRRKDDDRMAVYIRETQVRTQKEKRRLHDEMSQEMNEKFQRIYEAERQKENAHLKHEMDLLRGKNEELGRLVKKKKNFCTII